MKFASTALLAGLAATAAAHMVSAGQYMRLADCPVLPNTVIEDCNVGNYALRIGAIAVPGFLLAIGTIIAMCIYCCARCCCDCCGGRRQTQSYTNCNCCGTSCCCVGGNVPARYSKFEIVRVRLTALSLVVLGAIILIYGVVAAGQTQKGMNDLLDVVSDPMASVREFVAQLDVDLTITLYNATTDQTYEKSFLPADVQAQVDDVSNSISGSISDVVDAARSPIKGVLAGIFAAVIVPACILVLVALMGVFNIRQCGPMLAAAILFFLVFIVWILHAVVGVLSLLVGDVGAEVQGVVNLDQNVITALIPCPTDAVNDLRTTFDSFTAEELGSACASLNDRCAWTNQTDSQNVQAQRTFNCGGQSELDCSNPTSATLYQYATVTVTVIAALAHDATAIANGVTCSSGTDNCTMQLCASECVDQSTMKLSDIGRSCKMSMVTLEAAIHVEDVIERNAGQLYVCEVLIARVVGPFAQPMTDVANGAYNLRLTTGLEGIFCTFAVFVCAWGSKRFLALEEADRLQSEDNKATADMPDMPQIAA